MGPSATFGIAFIMTRYGSIILESRGDDHNNDAVAIPSTVPMMKPRTVSKRGISTWVSNDPSENFVRSKSKIRDGELNNNGSIQYNRLAISQNAKKAIRIINCHIKTILFSLFKRFLNWLNKCWSVLIAI